MSALLTLLFPNAHTLVTVSRCSKSQLTKLAGLERNPLFREPCRVSETSSSYLSFWVRLKWGWNVNVWLWVCLFSFCGSLGSYSSRLLAFLSSTACLDFSLAYLSSDSKPGSGLGHLDVSLLLAAPLIWECQLCLTRHFWDRSSWSSLFLWPSSSPYSQPYLIPLAQSLFWAWWLPAVSGMMTSYPISWWYSITVLFTSDTPNLSETLFFV